MSRSLLTRSGLWTRTPLFAARCQPPCVAGLAHPLFATPVRGVSSKSTKSEISSWTSLGLGLAGFAFFSSYFFDARAGIYPYLIYPLGKLILDGEQAHKAMVFAAKYNLLPKDKLQDDPVLQVELFGKKFPNPIGLAAGFDKDAEGMDALLRLGFGHVEVGSVTPLPQPGNPQPRVFRLPEDMAVINRYGFNSKGHPYAESNLRRRKLSKAVTSESSTSFDRASAGVIGVNLGKNKLQTDPIADYVAGVKTLGPWSDYLVVNVSSPNTPGLRALQSRDELQKLLGAVLDERTRLPNPKTPVLVKIAPDMTAEDLADVAAVVMSLKLDGVIVSNTTISRPVTLKSSLAGEVGGLSGAPLFALSTNALRQMYSLTKGTVPLIGVGGVSNGDEAYEKIRNGASLVQLYTSLVYEGPGVALQVKNRLSELLKRDGFKSVSEAVGVDVPISPKSSEIVCDGSDACRRRTAGSS